MAAKPVVGRLDVSTARKEIFSGHLRLGGVNALGDKIEARIKKVRDDGKLELSVRESAVDEIEGDTRKILDLLNKRNGKLPLNDNSSPEKIKEELNISKKAFKRAVGRLMKEGAVKTTDEGIESLFK